jgi:hypothetical protein
VRHEPDLPCQIPTPNTCTDKTPGQCTNVTGGSQTCGVGACARTVDRCADGALAQCVPGAPSAEICDGIDNDCDGKTDAADENLVLVPCDNQKGVCAGSTKPASLCVAGVWQSCTNANYASHSLAFQANSETTCETTTLQRGLDNDCDGSVDEDFSYTGPDGSTVQGANKACGVGVCAGGTTVCTNNTLTCTKASSAVAEICDGADNDCDGKTDSLDSTLTLVACENQKGVCIGSMKPASLCASGAWQPCGQNQYGGHSILYQGNETICDGADNDCSGAVDNNLVAPVNSNQNGACSGSKKKCTGFGGWVDDYSTVATYNQSETPDGAFFDDNCDGIDGDERLALFATTSGSAASNCTRAAPCTLARAIALANAQRPHIYLGSGDHLNGPFVITKSLKVFGGYNSSWVRKSRSTIGHESRIYGGNFGAESNHITLHISTTGITVDLADLYIHGGQATGQHNGQGRSSYAVYANGVNLNVERCDVIAGNGAPGSTGNNGTSASGVSANSGGRGENSYTGSWGGCDTSNTSGGAGATNASCDASFGDPRGGNGGAGGAPDSSSSGCGIFNGCCFDPRNGSSGGAAASSAGTSGFGGNGGGSCGSGSAGTGGGLSDGSGGAGTNKARGFVSGGFWWGFGGANGSLGRNGVGGGGGGGTGGCDNGVDQADTSGAGGGGGGAGGCRAPVAGTGGFAGGGSFGIFGISSTISVKSSTLTRATGGTGGRGGNGGSGQPGGSGGGGGSGNTGSKAGSGGGAGARGGHSGAGGGGAGGVSFGIFRFGGNLTESGNTFLGGAGGSSGAGGSGSSATQNGTGGVSGTSANTDTCAAAGGC